jgi:hypothetical protein
VWENGCTVNCELKVSVIEPAVAQCCLFYLLVTVSGLQGHDHHAVC